jgi:hypothetical protein
MRGEIHYVVTVEVSPQAEAGWADWYEKTHVPEVLSEPGFLGAVRTRDLTPAVDGWARYVTRYLLRDRSAYERYVAGSAAARLRQDHSERYGATTRVFRQVCEEL